MESASSMECGETIERCRSRSGRSGWVRRRGISMTLDMRKSLISCPKMARIVAGVFLMFDTVLSVYQKCIGYQICAGCFAPRYVQGIVALQTALTLSRGAPLVEPYSLPLS